MIKNPVKGKSGRYVGEKWGGKELGEDFLKKIYFFFEKALDNCKMRWYNSDINNK